MRSSAGLVLCLLPMTLPVACSQGTFEVPDPPELEPQEASVDCGIDESVSVAHPFEGTFDTDLTDTFCPRRDRDFWAVTTTGERKILTAELTYLKLSNIRLGMEMFGPSGLCVIEPQTTCSINGECSVPDEACDTMRAMCRPSGPASCALGIGCTSGQRCDIAVPPRPIQALLDDLDSGATSQHHLVAGFRALEQGDYVISVFDNREQEEDDDVEYTLRLSEIDEPDGNEPNDEQHLATRHPGDGSSVTAWFATSDDTDWYAIPYGGSSPPVVSVDLRWPVGSDLEPAWRLAQDGWSHPSDELEVVGSENVLRATVVAPQSGDFTLMVTNAGPAAIDVPYTLSVTVEEDPREGDSRNDTPATATVFDTGSAGSGTRSRTETLVAENDRDWFRIDTASSSDNSLMWISAVGTPAGLTEDTEYLLEMSVYQTCNRATECPTSTLCIDDSTCLGSYQGGRWQTTPWYRLPNPDGLRNCASCDPSMGGRTPNRLTTQLPVRDSGPATFYVLVNHIAANPLRLPGFSGDKTYSFQVQHKVEPDSGDRTNPDSRFVSRPLLGASRGDFRIRERSSGMSGEGYISFAGDNDFFTIPISADPGKLTVSLYYQGNVDVRVQVQRGGRGTGVSGNNCNPCTRPRGGECSYVTSTASSLKVWVNDDNHDDFDEATPYRFSISWSEGCPSECNEFVCSQ